MFKYLFMLMMSVGASCFATAALASLSEVSVSQTDSEGRDLELDKEVCATQQATVQLHNAHAKFSHSLTCGVETSWMSMETTPFGVDCLVGWYVDGYIATALNGFDYGKQVIFFNGAIFDISVDVFVYPDHFEHLYSWGRVYTYPYRQVVIFY